METYDVWVPERGGDLDLSLDVYFVQVVGDALLTDGLDGHLREKILLPVLQNQVSKMTRLVVLFLKRALELFFHCKQTAPGHQRTAHLSLIRLSTILVVVLYFHR